MLFKFEKRRNKYIKYFEENVHIHNIHIMYAACTCYLYVCVCAYKNICTHMAYKIQIYCYLSLESKSFFFLYSIMIAAKTMA